jgi:hypothetical protein
MATSCFLPCLNLSFFLKTTKQKPYLLIKENFSKSNKKSYLLYNIRDNTLINLCQYGWVDDWTLLEPVLSPIVEKMFLFNRLLSS